MQPAADEPAEPDEPQGPPPRRSRLLHPSTIATFLVLLLLATCAINNVRDRAQRAAIERALAPLDQEWSALREQAPPRLAAIEALLAAGGPPPTDACAALTGPISVIDRPMLTGLAAGDHAPRPDALWRSSASWQYLALARTPGRDLDAHRRRNALVQAALASPCLAVLEAEQATSARTTQAHQFEGGEVSGRLRIVCVDQPHVACELPVISRPMFAVSVVQRSGRSQAGADATAVTDAATRAYWQAISAALAERAPGLQLEGDDSQ